VLSTDEDPSVVRVDLASLFADRTITRVTAVSLTANQPAALNKPKWDLGDATLEDKMKDDSDDESRVFVDPVVALNPNDIKTYFITFQF